MQQHLKGQQPSALALQLAWGFQVDGGQIRETLKIIQQVLPILHQTTICCTEISVAPQYRARSMLQKPCSAN